MKTVIDFEKCCGCGQCAVVCPANAIHMKKNQQGFFYPFVDTELCVNCGKCARVCPMEVDVTDNSRKRKNGTECILCMECVKNCPKDAL